MTTAAPHPKDFVFTAEFETAFIGHLLADRKTFDLARSLDLQPANLSTSVAQRIASIVYDLHMRLKRHPTVQEVKAHQLIATEEARAKAHAIKVIDESVEAAAAIGLDAITGDMAKWKIAQTLIGDWEQKISAMFERHDLDGMIAAMEDTALKCRRIGSRGLTAVEHDAATWLDIEEEARRQRGNVVTSTGIGFLDDAMEGGIARNELVLVTSETGIGKTQLLAQIGITGCAANRKTHMLALEAEPGEIHRRIRYQHALQLARRDGKDCKRYRFSGYSHGAYPELAPYDATAKAELAARLKNFTVTYRMESKYSIEDCERDVQRVHDKVDLVLLDHLHVLDVDPKNENAAMTGIMQRLKDLSVSAGTPIVVAAHLRKPELQGKYTRLIPTIHDIHGSSNVSKIATHAIIIAPATGHANDRVDLEVVKHALGGSLPGIPTFVQLAKSRFEGKETTRYVAMAFFSGGGYSRAYVLGTLDDGGTKWRPVFENDLPQWARTAVRIKAPTCAV